MTTIEITPQFLRQLPLPDPKEGDKKARGSVLIIAGGRDVPGAALLAGLGAMRAGAGRLQLGICARHASTMAMAVPEALVLGLCERLRAVSTRTKSISCYPCWTTLMPCWWDRACRMRPPSQCWFRGC